MALPASWNKVDVFGTFKDRTGAACRGRIVFTSEQVVVVEGVVVVPAKIEATLDADGAFSIELPSTNDPDISATGWTYTVNERINGGRAAYAITVPYDSPGIDLGIVAPAIPVDEVTTSRGPMGPAGSPGLPRRVTVASVPVLSIPDASEIDSVVVTAQAEPLSIANPGGTPIDTQKLLYRITDNGTSQALAFGSKYAAMSGDLPTATPPGKVMYLGFIYRSATDKWDQVAGVIEDSLTPSYLADALAQKADASFVYAGGGGLSRNINDVLGEITSSTGYASLQNCIDYGVSAGVKVIEVRGNHIISGPVTLSNVSDVEIVFRGDSSITQTGTAQKTLSLINCSNIVIREPRLIGKGTEHNGASTSHNGVAAIWLSNCSNITIQGGALTNHAGGAIRWSGTLNGLIVTGVRIAGIGTAGGIVSGDNGNDFAIGSWSATSTTDVIIAENNISGHCFGIGCGAGSGVNVSGNLIHDIPGQHACYFSATSGLTVTGNTVWNCAMEGVKHQLGTAGLSCFDVKISGNHIWNVGNAGVTCGRVTGATGAYYERLTISDNDIWNCGTYGATVSSGRDCKVNDNKIRECEGHGLYLDEFWGEVRDNTVRDVAWNGLLATLTNDSVIEDNDLIDCCMNRLGGTGANYQQYLKINPYAAALLVAKPKVFIGRNKFRAASAEPATLSWAVYSGAGLLSYYYGNINLLSKSVRFSTDPLELKLWEPGYNPFADFTTTGDLNPVMPVAGRGRRVKYGTQSPQAAGSTDLARAGDFCWNATPAAGSPIGWVCRTSGTPGTWEVAGQVGVKTSIAVAPDFVGQTAVVSGVGYIATGIASAADWKQNTN